MSALDEVGAEMSRQIAKWGVQDHVSFTDDVVTDYPQADAGLAKAMYDHKASTGNVSWSDIFLEEVFEALDEAKDGELDKLRTELIQCAAVAVSWAESIDRNKH